MDGTEGGVVSGSARTYVRKIWPQNIYSTIEGLTLNYNILHASNL